MSCPDPLHDYEDWTDENGKEWKVGYGDCSEQSSEATSSESKPSYTDAMVAFHQHQYKRAIWKARVRRHRRG